MNITVRLNGSPLEIPAEPLTHSAFAAFGDVVCNPRPELLPRDLDRTREGATPHNAVSANQGSAIQYRDAGRMRNLLGQAKSGRSEPKMSVFVCQARELERAGDGAEAGLFAVEILERHPFTTQTFTPMASTATRYLVIVAPTLPSTEETRSLPVPEGEGLPGSGPPDLRGLRAFVATGAQAVTYGAGTWHSPMVVLGARGTRMDFVVVQFASGEAVEDCQFAEVGGEVRVRVSAGSRLERLEGTKERL